MTATATKTTVRAGYLQALHVAAERAEAAWLVAAERSRRAFYELSAGELTPAEYRALVLASNRLMHLSKIATRRSIVAQYPADARAERLLHLALLDARAAGLAEEDLNA